MNNKLPDDILEEYFQALMHLRQLGLIKIASNGESVRLTPNLRIKGLDAEEKLNTGVSDAQTQ